jgi:hypothetical protein
VRLHHGGPQGAKLKTEVVAKILAGIKERRGEIHARLLISLTERTAKAISRADPRPTRSALIMPNGNQAMIDHNAHDTVDH